MLTRQKLCFNCTGAQHRTSKCRSNRTCFDCTCKYNTSIDDKKGNNTDLEQIQVSIPRITGQNLLAFEIKSQFELKRKQYKR